MLQPPPVPEPPWARHKLRVPKRDETVYADPPLPAAAELARTNHDRLSNCRIDVQGRTLAQLRDWTRMAALDAARDYTSELRGEDVPEPARDLVIATGHQPSLYHPGVWAKNFTIAALASATGGTPLNLIVDNDTFSTTRIRLPVGDRLHPRIETEPFDADQLTQPWEEACVADRALFRSFADRVAQRMSPWGIEPLLVEMWPRAVAQLAVSRRLVDCLSAARHDQERRWGSANLELPASRLCQLDPFFWFASHILAHLPRFQEVHNGVLKEFRQVNRIRSRTHPVPELRTAAGWVEAPFWMWHKGEEVRRRVYARQSGRHLRLADTVGDFAVLRLTPDGEACCAVEDLRALAEQGIRFRTRALTTTLFARLCLSDLFVHGIGGAKYDEMTDHIIARFFQLPPPGFLTLSATVYLPIAEPFDVDEEDARRLRRLLRDLRYNPERYLQQDVPASAARLVGEKRRLIAEQHAAAARLAARPADRSERYRSAGPERPLLCIEDEAPGAGAPAASASMQRRGRSGDNFRRFQRFQEINEQLGRLLVEKRRRLEEQLRSIEQQLEANAILKDREFPFCLYPGEKLQRVMTSLADGVQRKAGP